MEMKKIVVSYLSGNLRKGGAKMKMKKIVMICAVLVSFLGLVQGNARGAEPNLPDDFPEFIINQYGETAPGYLVGSVKSKNPNVGSYFMIMDNNAVPVFYNGGLGELVCNGLFTRKREIPGMRKKFTHHLYDEERNEVDVFQMGNGYLADDHDFQVLPNGHVLMFSYSSHTVDMSQMVEGGHPAANVTGAVIQELDVYKNVIFQWRSIDHIPVTDSYKNLTGARIGYIHVNSVELDETDGSLIISCRNTYDLIKISRATGEVIWRLSGRQNDFTFINENEDNAPLYIRGTHDARVHANGNITMFDNGAYEDDMVRTYSRAVEYDLDEVNMTATMVWEYRNDPDFLVLSGGDCIRLPNGNTTLNWGRAAKQGDAPLMTEADPNGNLVYEIWPAQNKVEGRFVRLVLPLEDQCTTVTQDDLRKGGEYVFNDTGVTLKVKSLEGEEDNEASVKRAPFAPLYPEFEGKAPRVLPVRVTISSSEIDSMNAEISFDAESFGFADRSGALGYAEPDKLTVYHRPVFGQGLFTPLPTKYKSKTKELRTTMTQLGEFIFCFADLEEVPYAPLLIEPQDKDTVNQELEVSFFWTPRGFGRNYHLQVAKDSEFTTLVVDEAGLMETRYTLETVEPDTTYYWRVNTTNYGGTGDWSTASFTTVPPMVKVTSPDGCEQWNRGLDFFIQWNDNIDEDVVIELYRGETLVEVIATTASTGVYEWEVSLGLEPGCDYSIKVTSSVNGALSDMSDTFSIDPPDTTPPVITCPNDIYVSGFCPIPASFIVTATDDSDPNVRITTDPPSGSLFPCGVTTVTATATDACCNFSTCSFDVIVSCFAINELKMDAAHLRCKGIALLEVTSDQGVFVYRPKPGKTKLKKETTVDDGVNGPEKIHTSGAKPLETGDVFGAYTVTNVVKIFDSRPRKKGDDLDVKGTFKPAIPIDLPTDEVIYVVDDGEGHWLEFTIPAGLFRVDGKPEDRKFKFKSPKGSYPEIDAKFDLAKCKFDLKVKRIYNLREITGRTLTVSLYVGANSAEETVQTRLKGRHLEHKKKPKLECCPE